MSRARDFAAFISTGALAGGSLDIEDVSGLQTAINGRALADSTILKSADIGTTILALDGDGSSLTGIESGVALYKTPDDTTANYMVKDFEVTPANFTPSGTWQVINKATLLVSELPSIDISGEYVETDTTLSSCHLFYDTLNLMADATLTISGTMQGIAGSTGSGVISVGASAVDKYQSTGKLYYFSSTQ